MIIGTGNTGHLLVPKEFRKCSKTFRTIFLFMEGMQDECDPYNSASFLFGDSESDVSSVHEHAAPEYGTSRVERDTSVPSSAAAMACQGISADNAFGAGTSEPAESARLRAYCFTINNYTDADVERLSHLVEEGRCVYVVYGKEVAPSSGTPHLQGFVYFKDPKKPSAAKKTIGKAHMLVSKDDPRGGYARAIAYCKKDGVFYEFGIAPMSQQRKGDAGKRSYEDALALAKAGKVEEIEAGLQVRFYNTWHRIANDYMPPPADCGSVTGVWIMGPTNCGKSSGVRKRYLAGHTFFRKMLNKWWDGYTNQEFVLIDDICPKRSELGTHIKEWCDRYSFPMEVKGGSKQIRPSLIFFTSQYEIGDIWQDPETRDAIRRRCYIINLFADSSWPTLDDIKADLSSRNDVNFSS